MNLNLTNAKLYLGIGATGPLECELHEAEGRAVVAVLDMLADCGITDKVTYEGHGGSKNDLMLTVSLRSIDSLRMLVDLFAEPDVDSLSVGVPGMSARDLRVFPNGFNSGDWLTLAEVFAA